MLNVDQLSQKVSEIGSGDLSVFAFELWFRRESRNAHQWGSAALNDLIDVVEGVFSEYHFGGLPEESVAGALDTAIRPFELVDVDSLRIAPGREWTSDAVSDVTTGVSAPTRSLVLDAA